MEPIANFDVPIFRARMDLKLRSITIPSPFSALSALGSVERIVGKLQPYLFKAGECASELGLVAINTHERTVVGRLIRVAIDKDDPDANKKYQKGPDFLPRVHRADLQVNNHNDQDELQFRKDGGPRRGAGPPTQKKMSILYGQGSAYSVEDSQFKSKGTKSNPFTSKFNEVNNDED